MNPYFDLSPEALPRLMAGIKRTSLGRAYLAGMSRTFLPPIQWVWLDGDALDRYAYPAGSQPAGVHIFAEGASWIALRKGLLLGEAIPACFHELVHALDLNYLSKLADLDRQQARNGQAPDQMDPATRTLYAKAREIAEVFADQMTTRFCQELCRADVQFLDFLKHAWSNSTVPVETEQSVFLNK